MQSLKKFYFGKQKAKVNTYIGGIGGTINTPALLAAKLGISDNRIKLFKVTGVDVECAVIGDYSLTAGLREGGLLTYFIDKDGLAKNFGTLQNFVGQNNMKEVFAPKTTYVRGAMCYNSSVNLKRVYMPLCTTFGEYNSGNSFVGQTSDSSMFLNSTSNLILYLHPSLQTVNSGNPDPDILDVLSRGGQVRYITNFTPPNPVTNLSVGTIYNTAVQLNFTPPTSVNGVDFYEVYVNNSPIPYAEITASGQFITGLTPSTNYNVTVVAVDIFYNKSVVSNTVNVSTFYNNSVDADATNYTNILGNSSFSNTIQSLFIDLKNTGLYFKIQAFYPFLGTTAAQHKWNAKNPLDTNAAFRLQFFGGGTHSNLGYQCNGTNAYANTFLAPSAVQNVNNNGLTIAVGTNNFTTKNDVIEIGSFVSVTQASLITTKSNNTTFRRVSRMNGETIFQDNQNDAKCIFTSVKQSPTVTKLLRNKVEIASGNSGGTLPTVSVFIGNLSLNGTPYTDGWSNQRIQFTAIHEGLTDAEVVALHTIIDNFESAIGRKTW